MVMLTKHLISSIVSKLGNAASVVTDLPEPLLPMNPAIPSSISNV